MPIRRAFARAAITSMILIAISAVALYAVASRLPEGGGLKLLRGATVEGLRMTAEVQTKRPRICLMTDCVKTDDDSRFCFMQRERLRDSGTHCRRPSLRIRLVQPSSAWPTRPGSPI